MTATSADSTFRYRGGGETGLIRADAVVEAYITDPLCGFGLDVASGRQMFLAARRMAGPDAVARIRSDPPVYLAAGDQDPSTRTSPSSN